MSEITLEDIPADFINAHLKALTGRDVDLSFQPPPFEYARATVFRDKNALDITRILMRPGMDPRQQVLTCWHECGHIIEHWDTLPQALYHLLPGDYFPLESLDDWYQTEEHRQREAEANAWVDRFLIYGRAHRLHHLPPTWLDTWLAVRSLANV